MSTNLIGKRINGYEVIRVLGRGGMGVVYKAHEMTLQRVVALKVLPNHLAENKEFITRFYREARAAAQLNHPNVVTIHRVGSDDGYHYIAMEYLKGRELTDIIKDKGQLEVNEALEIVRQMASALAAAHELGILHRDIKPHNVMIDNAGRVKVMDFGIAKINDSGGSGNTQALTMTGQLLGTPAYMSPEQCKGITSDHRSDIYSLGVVLYQALAGRVPFTGETPLAVIRKIVDDPVPSIYSFKQDVPDPVVQILHKALHKDPDQRYSSAADMENDIKRYLGGQEIKPNVENEMPTLIKMAVPKDGPTISATREMTQPQLAPGQAEKKKSAAPLIFFAAAILFAVVGLGISTVMKGKKGEGSGGAGMDGATLTSNSGTGASESPANPSEKNGATSTTMIASASTPAQNTPAMTPEVVTTPVTPPPTPEQTPEPTPTPKPNHKPSAKLALSAAQLIEGEDLTISFSASDPDEDALDLAYRIDGSDFWQQVTQKQVKPAGLTPGKHKVEFRVRDTSGETTVADASFVVKPKPEPPNPVNPPPAPPETTSTKPMKPIQAANVGEIEKLEGHKNNIMSVAFSPDGKRILSGGQDNLAILWDPASKQPVAQFKGHTNHVMAVGFSPDGKTVITGGKDNAVILWDANSGAELRRFTRHSEAVISVAIAPDGAFALSASADGTVCTWETATTSEVRRLAVGKIACFAFSEDGRTGISGGQEKTIGVWDLANGSQTGILQGGHTKTILALALSRDGRYAVSGGQDKVIRLWDLKSKSVLRSFEGSGGWIQSLAFSGDNRYVISGDKEYTVRLWDEETGSEIQAFRNHTGSVLSVAFSPKEFRAVSGSVDQTVRVWGLPE